jgi:hypothetical protein
MKREKHATTLLVAAMVQALFLPATAAAQEPIRSDAAKLVIEYLQQDYFLRPGVGLKEVAIGTPFEQVLRAWGEPTSHGRYKGTGNKWTYEIAGHTRIELVGDDRVTAMRVAGGLNSPYVTTEGASFGMPPQRVTAIYGSRDVRSGRIKYPEYGVSFILDQGRVSEIRVFSTD